MKVLSKIFICMLTLSTMFLSLTVQADSVFVQKIKSKGVDADSKEAIQEIISSAVTSEGHELVESSSEAGSILRTKVLKLGQSYTLKIDKLQDGKVRFSSKMKSADLEDMDVVAVRVVRSVLSEQSLKSSVTVTDVTKDEETRGTRRYQATRQWRFGFGPAWSGGLNVDGGGLMWGLGYVWGIDPDFDLKLNWSVYSPKESDEDNARFTDFALGMNYFLSRSKHSPFVSVEIGYASAAAAEEASNFFDLSDDEASGWAVSLGGGMKFFRTSTVNLGLFGSIKYLFDKTEKTEKTPRVTSVGLVVYY